MSKSVFGIATTHGQAERIVQQLQGQGFATYGNFGAYA